MIRRLFAATSAAILFTIPLTVGADHSKEHSGTPLPAEDWYRQSYAPLWNGTPAQDVEKILAHYADEIVTHAEDGTVSRDPQREWLAEPMAEWVAEGWLRAEMTHLETRVINASTASFVATWKDYYANGTTEVSCGWYLADLSADEWKITEYADTACP